MQQQQAAKNVSLGIIRPSLVETPQLNQISLLGCLFKKNGFEILKKTKFDNFLLMSAKFQTAITLEAKRFQSRNFGKFASVRYFFMSQRQSKIGDDHVSKFLKTVWFLQAIALKRQSI